MQRWKHHAPKPPSILAPARLQDGRGKPSRGDDKTNQRLRSPTTMPRATSANLGAAEREIHELAAELFAATLEAAAEKYVAYAHRQILARRALEGHVRDLLRTHPRANDVVGRGLARGVALASNGSARVLEGDVAAFTRAAANGARTDLRGEALGILVSAHAIRSHDSQTVLIDRIVVECSPAEAANIVELVPPSAYQPEVRLSVRDALAAAGAISSGGNTRERNAAPVPRKIHVYIGGYPWPFRPPSLLHQQFATAGVDGASLGLAVAVAAHLALGAQPHPVKSPAVILTGRCSPDGAVRAVGELDAKGRASQSAGLPLFYPAGTCPTTTCDGSQAIATLDEALDRLARISPHTA